MQQVLPIMAMQGLVVAAIALGAAWLTRCAFRRHVPGWCGALFAGLVIGAMLHSQCPISAVDPIFTGGQTEQQAIDKLTVEQNAQRQALIDTGVTAEAVTELYASHAVAMLPLIEAHAAAVNRHRDAAHNLLLLISAALLLIAGGAKPKRLGDALPLAIGAAVFIGAGAFAACWLLDLPGWLPLACVCAVGIVPISRRLTESLNAKTHHAESLNAKALSDDGASLVSSVAWWLLTLSLAVTVGLHTRFAPAYPMMGLFIALALLAPTLNALLKHAVGRLIAATAMAAVWLSITGIDAAAGAGVAWAGIVPVAWLIGNVLLPAGFDMGTLDRLAGPIVALLIGMQNNVLVDFHPWLLLAALIVMCDLRACGVWLATRLLGGRGIGLINGCILAIPGPVTLIVAWLLYDADIIDASVFNALLLASLIAGLLGRPVLNLARSLSLPSA